MKLTTKRDRWYFWREMFSYMIPMILIVGTVDVFHNFMICPLHPEWSAPCSVIWINAIMYCLVFVIVVIFAIFSNRKLKKIKKRIESEFLKVSNYTENKGTDIVETEKKSITPEKLDMKEFQKISENTDKKEITKKR